MGGWGDGDRDEKNTGPKGRREKGKKKGGEVMNGDMIMINYLPWVLFRLKEDVENDVKNDGI